MLGYLTPSIKLNAGSDIVTGITINDSYYGGPQ